MHPKLLSVHPTEASTESVFFAIRAAEKLLAEARHYGAFEPALSHKLLLEARQVLSHALDIARSRHQDTARLEQTISDIDRQAALTHLQA